MDTTLLLFILLYSQRQFAQLFSKELPISSPLEREGLRYRPRPECTPLLWKGKGFGTGPGRSVHLSFGKGRASVQAQAGVYTSPLEREGLRYRPRSECTPLLWKGKGFGTGPGRSVHLSFGKGRASVQAQVGVYTSPLEREGLRYRPRPECTPLLWKGKGFGTGPGRSVHLSFGKGRASVQAQAGVYTSPLEREGLRYRPRSECTPLLCVLNERLRFTGAPWSGTAPRLPTPKHNNSLTYWVIAAPPRRVPVVLSPTLFCCLALL